MSTPFASALSAYSNASRLISDRSAGGATAAASAVPQADFGQMLASQLDGLVEAGRASDQTSMAMVNGQASIIDMVTALAETETTMQTMVTVRDRVISAYEEIMRMPI